MRNQITKMQSALPVPTPTTLLEKAIEKGVDMAQLKELMDLQERWEKKEAKKAFLDALSNFQSMVPELKKGKTAKINSQKGSFSYKYADLGSITKAINPFLRECGLSYTWDFKEKGDKLEVTCHVSHRDGHEQTTSMEAGKDMSGAKNDIQQKGSTQTYLQRYTLIGALGLSTADEDIDGKGSSTTQQEQKQQPEQTEDEALEQWAELLKATPRQIELTALYMKNKKAVDGWDKLKAMFKDRQEELKQNFKPEKVSMP